MTVKSVSDVSVPLTSYFDVSNVPVQFIALMSFVGVYPETLIYLDVLPNNV